ncbi:MAG: hypothetical protein WKG07_47415 [Hymenobacter sp.]
MRFIVAPHEVSEAHLRRSGGGLPGLTVRYSRATPATVADARLLLIDNVGLLSQLYRFGQFAYVGGAFGAGGTIRWRRRPLGCRCFGPRYERFQEAVALVALGCALPGAVGRAAGSSFLTGCFMRRRPG